MDRVTPFSIVAMGLDGTLASHDVVSPVARRALRQARDAGVVLILVTGRTDRSLDATFPALREYFAAVVTDNGAVLTLGTDVTVLAPRVDVGLVEALQALGIEVECGERVVSCDARHGHDVYTTLTAMGLDLQIVHNRGRLMVLPAGVSKAAGLAAALHALGLSERDVVAVGDAENDHALLRVAAVRIAVANALDSLKRRADVVLAADDGLGVAEVLAQVQRGGGSWPGVRRTMPIGHGSDGAPAEVPLDRANILVQGPSGAGKSHLAGLLIEQWCDRGYRVLVVDVEGDYLGLQDRSDLVVLTGPVPPSEEALTTLLRWSALSVVVDLSQLARQGRDSYVPLLAGIVSRTRAVRYAALGGHRRGALGRRPGRHDGWRVRACGARLLPGDLSALGAHGHGRDADRRRADGRRSHR